jgi:hypothetical protein
MEGEAPAYPKEASALRRLFSRSRATRHNADPPTDLMRSRWARIARRRRVASTSRPTPPAKARAKARITSSRRLDLSSSLLLMTRGRGDASDHVATEEGDDEEGEEEVDDLVDDLAGDHMPTPPAP